MRQQLRLLIRFGKRDIKHGFVWVLTTPYIRVPADKHPKISPSEFEHWIKTHSNEGSANTNTTTVERKRSVLSSVSYNSSEEESSDEDTMPPTPTIEPLPVILISGNKRNQFSLKRVTQNLLFP